MEDIKYTIVGAQTIVDLQTTAKDFIADGWSPQGGMAVIPADTDTIDKGVYQAMVKKPKMEDEGEGEGEDIKYTIVEAETIVNLQTTVKDFITDGWSAQGGIVIVPNDTDFITRAVYQAMVKRPKPDSMI